MPVKGLGVWVEFEGGDVGWTVRVSPTNRFYSCFHILHSYACEIPSNKKWDAIRRDMIYQKP